MPRPHRITPGGIVYHVCNRGSRKGPVLAEQGDYIAFLHLIAAAMSSQPMRILAYCLMPNHWHFLLWPWMEGDLSRFLHWLTGCQATAWRRRTGTRGDGAVYQGRFVDVPIRNRLHLLTAWKYVERNPIEAGLVLRAEEWPWCSAAHRRRPDNEFELSAPPLRLPDDWEDHVNRDLPVTLPDADFPLFV